MANEAVKTALQLARHASPTGSRNLLVRGESYAAFLQQTVLPTRKILHEHGLKGFHELRAAIQQRWQRDNPWSWQLKHVRWFFTQHLKDHSDATRYYYRLTALLVWKRLGNGRELLISC